MKRLIWAFSALILFIVGGCQPQDTLTVTPTALSFTGKEDTKIITITSSGAWQLTMDPAADWCGVSNTSGRASMAVNVNVKENKSELRTAQLVITSAGCQPVTVTVTQAVKTAADNEISPEDLVSPDETSGILVEPSYPDADEPCTIVFKPQSSNPLYGHSGELYGHFGVVVDGEWAFVPTDWATTEEKTHFKKVGDNHWEFKMEPSIREYFGSGTTPVTKIALIVRTADGNKSHEEDQFCSVRDTKYMAEQFDPDPIVDEAVPSGLEYGMNIDASDNSVTFVFYDKDEQGKMHDYCYVVGDWNDWERTPESIMKRDTKSGCWWLKVSGFDPDKEYRFQYRLGNGSEADVRVSDPYTEIVYDQWNDQYIDGVPAFPEEARKLVAAFQINKPEYPWKHKDFKIEDKNDLVIYEMLFRDFTESQNIAGAMDQLDYIENLGVNAIELMPIQEFDGNLSWGYNPNHYFALDKYYGTREQYKEFIDECHARGIAVIVDVVYNHTTGQHPWALLWWAGQRTLPDNPWYNEYPTHPYNVHQDLNHENPMVKDHVKKSLEYLLTEYDVDGFRFDLTKGFTQKDTGGDNGNVEAWGKYDQGRVDILKGYADHIWSVNSDAVVIFEHLADWSEEKVLAEHGIQLWRNMNGSYRSSVLGGNGNFSGSYEASSGLYGGWVSYMESHDEERTCYGIAGDVSSVTWGLIGLGNKWGDKDDIILEEDGEFFSVKNVSIAASDGFKIRKAGVWDDLYNYGQSGSDLYPSGKNGHNIEVGKGFAMTLGASSRNMAVAATGVYDVYFSTSAQMIWVIKAGGARPTDAPAGTDDALSVAMRRAGANAAFFLTVPGPKMIWQFGEIGYDISIEDNGRTGEKPVLTDQYMSVPVRKGLYDTYASLLEFRAENPRFFDSDAKFRWYVDENTYPGKYLFNQVDGKNMAIFANFGKGSQTISVELPHGGDWYNYYKKDEVWSGANHSPVLKEGEFVFLVDWK